MAIVTRRANSQPSSSALQMARRYLQTTTQSTRLKQHEYIVRTCRIGWNEGILLGDIMPALTGTASNKERGNTLNSEAALRALKQEAAQRTCRQWGTQS